MLGSNIKTPGVYIDEINALPNSVVPVPTAVPAFIGYTPQAEYDGKSYTNKVQKITSFSEFKAIYCIPDAAPPADASKQYNPQYYVVKQKTQPASGDYLQIKGTFYSVVPDPNTIYYLYNSIRLFYQNGGGDAYIISVGGYGKPSGTPGAIGKNIVNPNVKLNELLNGLALLQNENEPTMYICPEATLLSVSDNGTLIQKMLLQCAQKENPISIFDIIGGNNPDPILYTSDIETFRNNTGNNGLDYGAAYYPFVGTTVTQSNEIDYTNLFGGDIKQLATILTEADGNNDTLNQLLDTIQNPGKDPLTVSQYNNALINTSKTYYEIINHILADVNMLPPSGGMAGVITVTDNEAGVWQAPANKTIVGANTLPIKLNDSQQANLNVDAVTGKSVNAIRFFNGQGILIWGARTLDGNSNDWRYISVRRTVSFIQQSSKLAMEAYVFEPNTVNTWSAVKSSISNFLTSVWKEGGLQGATAADAFSVQCGLGTTMTGDDILNGVMNVTIKVAVTHPAEFIVITLQQQMATGD